MLNRTNYLKGRPVSWGAFSDSVRAQSLMAVALRLVGVGLIITFLQSPVMAHGYYEMYGNSMLNSYIAFDWNSELEDVSHRQFPDSEPVRMILSSGARFILVTTSSLRGYDASLKETFRCSTYVMSPVAVRDEQITFLTPESRGWLRSCTFTGDLILAKLFLPYCDDHSNIQLFHPVEDDLAVITYPMDPQSGSWQMIFRLPRKPGATFSWFASNKFAPVKTAPVYISQTNTLVVPLPLGNVIVYSMDAGATKVIQPQPVHKFTIASMGEEWLLSADEQGRLYWCGEEKDETALIVTDITGKEIYSARFEASLKSKANPVMPPIVAGEYVIIVMPDQIICSRQGKMLWKMDVAYHHRKCVTACNSGIVLGIGHELQCIAYDGIVQKIVPMKDVITTPPVVLENGSLVVGHEQAFTIVR